MIKENDWLVATINNPGFTADDFRDVAGMTLDNTQLLSADEYLKSDFIRENKLFTNERGEFNEQKFRDFYKQKTQEFQSFATDASVDNYEYGLWDTTRPADGRVRDSGFKFIKVSNPDFHSIGITGPNQYQESGLSVREIAQMSKIAGRDYSVNDMSLVNSPIKYIKSLFQDPLVLATYDEDTTEVNPITGIQEFHPKGSPRLNSDGQYFYEELGGRSTIGKQVLSAFDYLTVDQQGLNAIDFMDSDDKSKSMGGQIMKSIVELVPMAFGNKARFIYGGILAVKELAKAAPMLTNMVESAYHLFDSSQPEESTLANTIAGFGTKFSTSSDDYTQQNPISFGMITNLITDVATQWGQQRAIQKAYVNLTGGAKKMEAAALAKAEGEFRKQETLLKQQRNLNKISEQEFLNQVGTSTWKESNLGQRLIQQEMAPIQSALANRYRIGGDLSLAHMAIISNTDMYETALEHGATKKEAAALSLGSIAGMFSVDKFLGLGEMFLEKPEKAAANALRQSVKQESEGFVDGLKQLAKMPESPQKYVNIMKKGSDFGKNIAKKYVENYKAGTLGIVGKAFGEGLEETAEELVTDLVKTAGELAGDFGLMSQSDLGAWDNMLLRYGMSFVGGFVGGGIFGAMDVINNPSNYQKQEFENIITYLRNGKKDEINKIITQLEDEGKFASTTLSYRTTEDGSTFLTAQSKEDSQNHYVAQRMRELVTQVDDMLTQNDLKKTDDDLFRSLVLNEQNYVRLKKFLQNDSYSTGYQAEYNKIVKGVLDTEIAIKQLQGEQIDSKKSSDPEYQKKLDTLQKKRDELLQRKEDFLSGKESFKYMSKLMFAINPNISQPWYSSNFDSFVYNKTFKDVAELSEVELNNLKQEYEAYKQLSRNLELDRAYEIFSELQKRTAGTLESFNNIDVNSISQLQQQYQEVKTKIGEVLQQTQQDIKIPIFEKNGTPAADLNQFGTTTSNQVTVVDGVHHATLADGTKVDQPSKQIYITGQEQKGYFELVKDQEDGQYAIHFKPTDKNNPKAFTNQEKDILFKAAAEILPEGAKLSTWGELSKGGIHGLERFRNLGFTQVGTRDVKTKQLTDQQKHEQIRRLIQQFVDNASKTGRIDTATYRSLRRLLGTTVEDIKDIYANQWLYKQLKNNSTDGLTTNDIEKLVDLFKNGGTKVTEEQIRKVLSESQTFKDILDQYKVKFTIVGKENVGGTEMEIRDFLESMQPDIKEIKNPLKSLINTIEEQFGYGFRNIISAENLLTNLEEGSNIERAAASVYQAYKYIINHTTDQNLKDYATQQMNYVTSNYGTVNLNDSQLAYFIPEKIAVHLDESFIKNDYNGLQGPLIDELSQFGHDTIANVEQAIDAFTNDADVQLLEQLDSVKENKGNPTYVFLNQLLQEAGIESEQLLNNLFNRLFANADEFILDPNSDLTQLSQISNIIQIGITLLNAASQGHNASLNRIADKHKLNLSKLPELSSDVANIVTNNLRQLLIEIEELKRISEINQGNLAVNFLQADKKFINIRLNIFDTLARSNALIINGIDLLEGVSDIQDADQFTRLFKIEQKVFENVQKALADGSITIKQIYDALGHYLDYKSVKEQKSSKIDKQISESNFTQYDKFVYLTTVMAYNPSEFYQSVGEFINQQSELVPLPAQLYGERIIRAMEANPDFINAVLDYIAEGSDRPILHNTTVTTGIGGSGKTSAQIKLATLGQKLVVSGPTTQQSQQLKAILDNSTEQSIEEIIKTIVGSTIYEEIKADLDKDTSNYFTKILGIDDVKVKSLNTNNISFDQDAYSDYDTIVIDEATHIPVLYYQILSQWANKYGKNIILVGDLNQSSISDINIRREGVIQWKTPELNISLRNSKFSKWNNQQQLLSTLKSLIDSDTATEDQINQIQREVLKKLQFRYIKNEELTGDLVTKELSDDVINSIKTSIDKLDPNSKTKVAFIGDTNSATYQKLVGAGIQIDQTFSEIKDIQGREFDYVISTLDWSNHATDSAPATYELSKNLYTVISRGRKGTIIIDNGLSQFIKGSEEYNKDSDIRSIMEHKDKFVDHITIQLNNIVGILNLNVDYGNVNPSPAPAPSPAPTSPTPSPSPAPTSPSSAPSSAPTNPSPTPAPTSPTSTSPSPTTSSSTPGPAPTTASTTSTSPAPTSSSATTSSPTTGSSKSKKTTVQESQIEKALDNIDKADQEIEDEIKNETGIIEERNSKQQKQNTPVPVKPVTDALQVRAYGNISLLGAKFSKQGDVTTWLAPDQSQTTLSDAELFLNQNTNDGSQKDSIINRLLYLKSLLTFPDLNTKVRLDLRSNENLKNIAAAIGRNTLQDILKGKKEIQFYVRVTSNTNRLVGLTNLDNDLLNFYENNGKQYAALVVAKFKTDNGKTAEITLGALANGETWRQVVDDDSIIDRYEENLANYSRQAESNGGTYEFEINTPNFAQFTNVVTKDPNKHKVRSRLKGINQPSEFEIRSRYAVVSPVYIDTDPSHHTNRAHIYVSSYMPYSPEQLKEIYAAEEEAYRNAPDSAKPPFSVRKIELSNAGISFRSLSRNKFLEQYKVIAKSRGKQTVQYLPFESLPVGIKMFEAIHNYRVDLQQLRNFLDSQNIDLNKLAQDIKARQQLFEEYSKNNKNWTYEEFVSQLDPAFQYIDILNQKLSELNTRFRIGYAQSGAYIGKDNHNKSNTDNCIYIHPEIAQIQLDMLNSIYDGIISQLVDISGLNPYQYIKLDKSTGWVKRFRSSGQKLSIVEDGKQITLDSSGIERLPYLLSKIVKYTNIVLEDTANFTRDFQIKAGKNYLQINEFLDNLGKIYARSQPLSPTDEVSVGMIEEIHKVNINGEEQTIRTALDTRIENMFDLIFHGAITADEKSQDFLSSNHQRYEKAPFKYGIYIDAMAGEHGNDTELKSGTNWSLFYINCLPAFPLMTVELKPKDKVTKPQSTTTTTTSKKRTRKLDLYKDGFGTLFSGRNITDPDLQQQVMNRIQQIFQKTPSDIVFTRSGEFQITFSDGSAVEIQKGSKSTQVKIGNKIYDLTKDFQLSNNPKENKENAPKTETTKQNQDSLLDTINTKEKLQNTITKFMEDLQITDYDPEILFSGLEDMGSIIFTNKDAIINYLNSIINNIEDSGIEDNSQELADNILNLINRLNNIKDELSKDC